MHRQLATGGAPLQTEKSRQNIEKINKHCSLGIKTLILWKRVNVFSEQVQGKQHISQLFSAH